MKKTIKTILATTIIASTVLYQQGAASASTQVVTEDHVKEAILWIQENSEQLNLSEEQAEKIASIDVRKIDLSQKQLDKINMSVMEQQEVAFISIGLGGIGISSIVLVVAAAIYFL